MDNILYFYILMCDSIPVRLVFASSDPGIYETSYKWTGQMYVSVDCGNNVNFQSLNTSPFTWNFCNSNCKLEDRLINVIFTFKPQSNDPNDSLHFVVDTRGYVITRPLNKIVDTVGKPVKLDIESISRHGGLYGPDSLMEVWLATGAVKGVFLPEFRDGSGGGGVQLGTVNWEGIVKTIAIGLIVTAVIIGGVYLINRFSNRTIVPSLAPVVPPAIAISYAPVPVQEISKSIVPKMVL